MPAARFFLYICKMTRKLLAIIGIIAAVLSCGPAPDSTEALLRELDQTLANKQTYEGYFAQRVQVLRDIRSGRISPEQEYEINKSLAAEFQAYSLDSTILYLDRNREIARGLQDRRRLTETDLLRAREYAMAGYHSEAKDIFDTYESSGVPEGNERLYYDVGDYLYGEIAAYYSSNNSQYWQRRSDFRNGLKTCLEDGSYQMLDLLRVQADGNQDKALAADYARRALEVTSPGTREYARAAYFVSTYQEDANDRIQWLAKSAIADCICATKDYASLNELAGLLYARGDIDRAFHYAADHGMPDAIRFNGKLRPWQIAQFFPQIEKAYAAKSGHTTRMLILLISIAVLLLLALAAMIWYLFRSNHELTDANRQLKELNAELQESNKIRQEYIGLFLQNLSENISTSRQYKNHVLKYLRRGNDNYIIEEIEALPPIEDDILQFNRMFDRTFINLYPDFVEKFNALLQDGETITPKGDDILTPELRVFALIKLGVTESSRIASLLHYSANTVYNYRAKIKNKARGNRELFEQEVQAIE